MILVDTSVWIDHLRTANKTLVTLLAQTNVLAHPWVTGELALGTLRHRENVVALMNGLPQAVVAGEDEVLALIRREVLAGKGIGYVDAQLLAATRLTPGAALWTKDKRLLAAATTLAVAYQPT